MTNKRTKIEKRIKRKETLFFKILKKYKEGKKTVTIFVPYLTKIKDLLLIKQKSTFFKILYFIN